MKRLFILSLCLCLSIALADAQVRIDRGYETQQVEKTRTVSLRPAVHFGIKAGALSSTLNSEMTFDPEFRMGFGYTAGLVVNLHWGQRTETSLPGTGIIGIQPEMLFAHREVRSNGGNLKFNDIQIPVMLKIYPLAQLSIELGPEFSYLLSASPESVPFKDAEVQIGDCAGFHFGAGAGLAYEFDFGLMFGARYSMGFTDLARNLKWQSRNNVQVSVGWLF